MFTVKFKTKIDFQKKNKQDRKFKYRSGNGRE